MVTRVLSSANAGGAIPKWTLKGLGGVWQSQDVI